MNGTESSPAPTKSTFKKLIITAVGDIMLGGSAAPEMEKYGYDYPFEHVKNILHRSQIVFGNLEGPLTDHDQAHPDKQYTFRSPPHKVAPALAAAGFNVLSLANNHTMDYGVTGLQETLTALTTAGISPLGAGMNEYAARQPVLFHVSGQRVALLAYSLTFPEEFWAGKDKPGTAFGHEAHILADVVATRNRADIVLVSFHWGREATTVLRDYQSRLAYAAIDAGAHAVIGHHPHVLQGIEQYKQGVILYSLGNFAFGSYSKKATRSIIAELEFHDGRLRELRAIPINVDNTEVVFQPRPLTNSAAREVIMELQRLSAPLGTELVDNDGIGILVPDMTHEKRVHILR